MKELDNLEVKESDFSGKYQCYEIIINDNKNQIIEDDLKKNEKSLKKKRNRQN